MMKPAKQGHCQGGCGIDDMHRKFYKLLIIGNLLPTILHIQTRGVGGMGRWGDYGAKRS
jgi:hypothetical protein